MNYNETLDWLFEQLPMFQRVGQAAYKADLSNTIDLLDELKNPQDSFRAIHIAGTNGKGSVSHMIASILQEAGLKTGLYTSPHLKDFRERIKINGEMIPEEKVVEFVDKNQKWLEDHKISFFEMTVGMAYQYFKEEKVDFAVLETGMGGRLDSTNISNPVLSIITNIGYDHMAFLGNTLEKIAGEKAGIIKEGIPVVIGRKQSETKPVFEKTAKEKNAPIFYAEDHFEAKAVHTARKNEKHYDIWLDDELYLEDLSSPLLGEYQMENIATAFQGIKVLNDSGILNIDKDTIAEGFISTIANTGLKGRWTVISTNPLTIADTGHNTDGIMNVVQQLMKMDYEHLHFVFGMVSDKDRSSVLRLLPKNATYYFCKANIPRGLDAEILQEEAAEFKLTGQSYISVTHAYSSAVNNAGPNDLVFVGGSTFIVAEII
ncbi:MAG: bifunctional folylpolyglutamate synthase/dihydrofolate synthase [Bacteroidales bacterium]|nr:bifunctional folylpolyglutamate synthase/dihydrofolate synthase [Bacteroidales bacterium]